MQPPETRMWWKSATSKCGLVVCLSYNATGAEMRLGIWLPSAILVVAGTYLLATLPRGEPPSGIAELAGKHFTQADPISFHPVRKGDGIAVELKLTANSPIAGCVVRSISPNGRSPYNLQTHRFGPLAAGEASMTTFLWKSGSISLDQPCELTLSYDLTWQDGFALTDSKRTERIQF